MTYRIGLKQMKWAVAGVALAAAMAGGTAASAASVIISNGTMTNPIQVTLSGTAFNGTVEDAPMQFSATIGGKAESILAFCVDVYHEINTGSYKPSLQYETNTFKTDSNPNPTSKDNLSSTTITQIDTLVNYGTEVEDSKTLTSTQKSLTEAEVQGAIWQLVAGEDVKLSASSVDGVSRTTFDNVIDALSGASYKSSFLPGFNNVPDNTTFITPTNYPNKSGTQSFMFAGMAVPEPASWMMMIGGLGLVGAVLRRRRAVDVSPVQA